MNASLSILFFGAQGGQFDGALQGLGNVTYSAGQPASLEGFDLVATDSNTFSGDYRDLFQKALEAGVSFGLVNLTKDQAAFFGEQTGIYAPNGVANGILVGKFSDREGKQYRQVKYLPLYPEAMLEVARESGVDVDAMINSFIQTGVRAHFEALQLLNLSVSPENASPPPTNNLIPTYSQVPFSIYQVAAKTINMGISNMKNLSNLSLTFTAQVYLYRENASGNNDIIAIIVAQMNNVSNGNPLYYSESDTPSCSIAYQYAWYQYFNYSIQANLLNSAGSPITNLTVYNSSPAPATHGPTTVTDSVGVPNPFSIFMTVNSGGSWIPVNFPASYLNTIQLNNLQFFDISSLDNTGNGTAGVKFNMPTNLSCGTTRSTVAFETTHIFRLPASLIDGNNQLLTQFKFTINLGITQKYSTMVFAGGTWSPPSVVQSTGGGPQYVTTDQVDLVALTQPQ